MTTVPVRAEMKPADYERWQERVCSTCQYNPEQDEQSHCPQMLMRVYVDLMDTRRVECVNYYPRNDEQ